VPSLELPATCSALHPQDARDLGSAFAASAQRAAGVRGAALHVSKGVRVRARLLQLAQRAAEGASFRFVDVVGVVRHVRGDDVARPEEIRLYLDPDGEVNDRERSRPDGCSCAGAGHLVIRLDNVTAVL